MPMKTTSRNKQAIPWSEEELAQLGKDTDSAVSVKTGRTLDAVRSRRLALKIPIFRENDWTESQIAMLGNASDREVAKMTGRTPEACYLKRKELRIPCSRKTAVNRLAILILKRVEAGERQSAIANEMLVSKQYVNELVGRASKLQAETTSV